jgi:hypothetical protein
MVIFLYWESKLTPISRFCGSMIMFGLLEGIVFQQVFSISMKTSLLVLLVSFLMAVPACDFGAGRFVAVGTESSGSLTNIGCLSIVEGYSVKNGSATGDKKKLLYLMIICSGVKPAADQEVGGGIEGDPMSKPEIYYQWGTTTGPARASLEWNTASDTISIGGKEFNREDGDTFFIERKADGSLFAQQCGKLGPDADFLKLAKRIRDTMRDNDLVRAAKFRGVDN